MAPSTRQLMLIRAFGSYWNPEIVNWGAQEEGPLSDDIAGIHL